MSRILKIEKLEAGPGEKIQGFIPVYDEEVKIPVTLINGGAEGKTVLITAGVHGAEYGGIQTVIELAKELDPAEVSGKLILVHPVNTEAFKARSFAIVPEDGKNLNREFPGEEKGTFTQKLAYLLTREFHSQADFYIDLHGGDLHEKTVPFVYYPGIATEEVIAFSRDVAHVLDVKYMVKSQATTGAYNSAAIRGVPSLLIERGGAGVWNQQEVAAYKKDILSVLEYLGVIKRNTTPFSYSPRAITKAIYLESEREGFWYPQVEVGEYIVKGQLLGEIHNCFGETLETYYSEIDGVVLYMLVALAASKGDTLVAYGEIGED